MDSRLRYFLALGAATVAVGCGGDDDETNADRYDGEQKEVASLVDEFAEAGRDGDGERVCTEIFADTLAKNVEQQAKQSCATEVEENLPEGEYELTADSIEVKGGAATAAVTDQADNKSVLHLTKNGDEWRVVRVTPAA
jgi:hypothetical protein